MRQAIGKSKEGIAMQLCLSMSQGDEGRSGHSLAAAKNVKMYAFPSHSIVPGPSAASSRADRVPTTDVSTRLRHTRQKMLAVPLNVLGPQGSSMCWPPISSPACI